MTRMAGHRPASFGWSLEAKVGHDHTQPARTQESADLRELRGTARPLSRAGAMPGDAKAVVITGAGGNFCSGGDVHEIIGPLTQMDMPELLAFHPDDRRSGQSDARLSAAGRSRRSTAVCAGAGAIIAMAVDLRLGTPRAKTAFLFTRVGLAGCDMGACAILPRIIGQGRASELLYHRPRHDRRGGRTLGLLQSHL